MLKSLQIENIAIIEKCEIKFDLGLNVLTGETGAGKSIIIDSINAVLGERTSKELIRTGANSAKVVALFENIGASVKAALKSIDIPCEDDNTLLVQRTINADGKNNCRINGTQVTVSMLKTVGRKLINIHGQNDNQSILAQENHINFIDLMAKNDLLLTEYKDIFDRFVATKKEIKSLQMDEYEKEKTLEILEHQIKEIEEADIKVGELDTLIDKREKFLNSEKLLSSLKASYDTLGGTEDVSGVVQNLQTLHLHLSKIEDYYKKSSEIINDISDFTYRLEDFMNTIRNDIDLFDFDQISLEETEDRIDVIQRLMRKHSKNEDELISFYEECKNTLGNIKLSDEKIIELTENLESIGEELIEKANELSKVRRDAADEFIGRVEEELAFLEMPNVKLSVLQNEKPFGSKGKDYIEFYISTNVGEDSKQLTKIASGGEVSRIMLAIKNVLSDSDEIGTMIFDEIDAGVSGKAAQKIALKLSEVSQGRQVICVTHLAQIAAQADRHLLIEKRSSDNSTYTEVRALTKDGSKFELARIMGGMVITQSQLKAAEELIEQADMDKRQFKEKKINGTKEN